MPFSFFTCSWKEALGEAVSACLQLEKEQKVQIIEVEESQCMQDSEPTSAMETNLHTPEPREKFADEGQAQSSEKKPIESSKRKLAFTHIPPVCHKRLRPLALDQVAEVNAMIAEACGADGSRIPQHAACQEGNAHQNGPSASSGHGYPAPGSEDGDGMDCGNSDAVAKDGDAGSDHAGLPCKAGQGCIFKLICFYTCLLVASQQVKHE